LEHQNTQQGGGAAQWPAQISFQTTCFAVSHNNVWHRALQQKRLQEFVFLKIGFFGCVDFSDTSVKILAFGAQNITNYTLRLKIKVGLGNS